MKMQAVPWRTVLWLCLIVFFGTAGCGSSGPTFKDVESGNIPLAPIETQAIEALLKAAGIPPAKLPVYTGAGQYQNAYTGQKILVENGHVTILQFRGAGLQDMEPVSAFSHCRDLDLSDNRISRIKGLPEAQKLEGLSLWRNRIREPAGLGACVSLKTLDISANKLTRLPDISRMLRLQRLVLSGNQITSLEGMTGGEKLDHLDLSINQLTSLAGLPNLPNLTSLWLRHNQLTSLEGFGEMPRLRTVSLESNQLESADQLAACPLLESVDLKSNKISKLPNFPKKIARLEFGGNPVEKILAEGPKKPQPRLVRAGDAVRVPGLPAAAGKLYGGGVHHSKVTTGSTSKHLSAVPTSFRFSRENLSLTGTAGFNPIPMRYRVTSVRVTIFVKQGRVRIYLKDPGDFKYIKNKYGKDVLTEVPNEDFIYADAAPEQPCTLQGDLLISKYSKYEILLQALDGSASGITYIISNS